MIDLALFEQKETLQTQLEELEAQSILKRIWDHDHTVWSSNPSEISNRLGWLDIPVLMNQAQSKIKNLAESLRDEKTEKIVLLGMGGSSLAPDVFSRVFEKAKGYPELVVLDTTHPDAIAAVQSDLNLAKTTFIVATKSGSTVETLSLFRYFYNQLVEVVGNERAVDHFIAITDPESALVATAEKLNFRETFENDPDIGGRYSALSYFGLVPAALIGIDIETLLQEALKVRQTSLPGESLEDNEAVVLGTILGWMANIGRDKLTLISSVEIEPVGDWIEQLVAESTGKQGKGILPVVGERMGTPADYGSDRIFVHLRWKNDSSFQPRLEALASRGHPVVIVDLDEIADLGGLFFLWELATAVAGYWMGINPFDQPNVESAKKRAKEMVAAFQEQGALPQEEPLLEDESLAIYLGAPGVPSEPSLGSDDSVEDAIKSFLRSGGEGAYVAIQAYLPPSDKLTGMLRELQVAVRDRTGLATTLGYGPRFLHSTGQLHKGDAGDGLFLQLTNETNTRIDIPDQPGSAQSTISFGTLINAQALGDRRALLDANRSIIRIALKGAPTQVVNALASVVA